MAVRNLGTIGGSRNVKPIPTHVWIPPIFNVIHKIVINDGSTTYDVTDLVIDAEFKLSTTETIGSFNLTVDNSAEVYTSVFNGWNKVYLYLDYGSEATTKIFTGMIEKPAKSNNNIVLSGQSSAARFYKKFITYSATNKAKSEILTDIIGENFSDLGTSGVEENSTLATVNYSEVYFQDIITDLCGDNYEGYVDEDFVMQYFEAGSRTNQTEAVVHDMNLISSSVTPTDLEQYYNNIRVYGKDKDSIPLLYTSKDESSITNYDQRDLKIEMTTLTKADEVARVAEYEKAKNTKEILSGNVTSLALPTLKPGEKLRVSDPQNGIPPAEYQTKEITFTFSNDEPPFTEVVIEKSYTSMSKYLGGRFKYETDVSNRLNPLGLDYSYIVDFLTNAGTFNGTSRVASGVGQDQEVFLRIPSAGTGTWVSPALQLEKAPDTTVQFRLSGEKIEGVSLEYSFNGGTTYTTWGSGDVEIIASDEIVLRVTITDVDTRLKYIGILYT